MTSGDATICRSARA